MTATITAPFEALPATRADPSAGPVVVAVGGADPPSVLRAARMIQSHAAGGMLAVSVLAPPPVAIVGEAPALIPQGYLDQQRAVLAEQLGERLRAAGGTATSWHTRVIDGEPAFALADLARSVHASLLVMGIGRHRTIDRVLGAETTLRAIRIAPCPVLAVHPDFDGPFHDVVVAVDFSPASTYAAQIALSLVGPTATLHLVHVWQPRETDDVEAMASNEAYRQSVNERFARLGEVLAVPTGIEVKQLVREGRPAECVLDYASAHHADLVVAGRHGLNPFERLIVGSQTTALLRDAGRSLLVAPEPPFATRDRLRLLLTGASRSTEPDEWKIQLDAFTERNHGRPAVIDVEDLLLGSRVIESDLKLVHALYDPSTERVEITLADPDRATHRVTRLLGNVNAVHVTTDLATKDRSLRVNHGSGRTVLTFMDV